MLQLLKYNIPSKFAGVEAAQEDIGVQASEQFIYTENIGIGIHYQSENQTRLIIMSKVIHKSQFISNAIFVTSPSQFKNKQSPSSLIPVSSDMFFKQ